MCLDTPQAPQIQHTQTSPPKLRSTHTSSQQYMTMLKQEPGIIVGWLFSLDPLTSKQSIDF